MVEKLPGEELYSITGIKYGDDCWKIYEEWGESVDYDPRVTCGFWPPDSIVDSVLTPSDALIGPIQREANSIVHYYAAGNVIGPPLRAPLMNINVHHAAFPLSKLMEEIQQPPQDYPTINSLKSGCTVNQQWANTGVEILLFKP